MRGIIIFGPSGSGKTTLGAETARLLGFKHIDIDDYHWRWDTEIPYTVFRPNEERINDLMNTVEKHPDFVMSGSMWSIRKPFEPFFDLGVYITAPAEIRAERLRSRSIARWGDRVLPGGDMYETHDVYNDYLADALKYDTDNTPQAYRKQHEQWAEELPCPVLRLDGMAGVPENAERIAERFHTEYCH